MFMVTNREVDESQTTIEKAFSSRLNKLGANELRIAEVTRSGSVTEVASEKGATGNRCHGLPATTSPHLASLAAATVVTATRGLALVQLRLASDTQTHTGNRLATQRWNRASAFLAALEPLAAWQPAAREFNRLPYTGVDLILNRTVFCPATCHDSLPCPDILRTNTTPLHTRTHRSANQAPRRVPRLTRER